MHFVDFCKDMQIRLISSNCFFTALKLKKCVQPTYTGIYKNTDVFGMNEHSH
jgi:hypothetical protein